MMGGMKTKYSANPPLAVLQDLCDRSTQRAVAARIGLSEQMVGALLHGDKPFTARTAAMLGFRQIHTITYLPLSDIVDDATVLVMDHRVDDKHRFSSAFVSDYPAPKGGPPPILVERRFPRKPHN